MIYFDAAYIAKCYLPELGAEHVIRLAETVEHVVSCEVSRLEFSCVLHRHTRENRVTPTEAARIWNLFLVDEGKGEWRWLPPSSLLIRAASDQVRSLQPITFVRSIDALHLTCAKENGFSEIYTNDRHILAAAPLFGMKAINILP